MEPSRQELWSRVADWWRDGKTPENHDILKATHAAYVAAMKEMAGAIKSSAVSDEEDAAGIALAALAGRSDFATFRWDGEHLPLAETQGKIEALFAGRHVGRDEEERWRLYNGIIVADLAVWGVDLPARSKTLFLDGIGNHAPWHITFRRHFAEAIKRDDSRAGGERAFRILTVERLGELTAASAILIDAATEVRSELRAVGADVADVKAMVERLLLQSEDSARARGVNEQALRALAERIAENVADTSQALIELGRAIDELIRLREDASQGSDLGGLVDRVLLQMAKANELGRFDEAAEAGARAFAEWDMQQSAQQRAGLRLIGANIEQERLRYDADAMSRWICQRLRLEGRGAISTEQLRAEQDIWYENGLALGNRLELDVAIILAEYSVDSTANDVDRATCLSDLALALRQQGTNIGGESGLALLARAVDACEEALKVRTRDDWEDDWALTQNILGATLRNQAAATKGEMGRQMLDRAIRIYESVLELDAADAASARWAMTQNNLAVALQAQSQRSEAEVGIDLLERAIMAHEDVLRVSRKHTDSWARTQNNLGSALEALGELLRGERGMELLARGVEACEAALEFRTFEERPADWAVTKENLAVIRLRQSEFATGDTARRHASFARVACDEALLVFRSDHMPYYYEKALDLRTAIDIRMAELAEETPD